VSTKKRYHITIIEDDQNILEIFNTYLKQNGFFTTCFNTAEEALVSLELRKMETDLILSDFHFPTMNGSELIKRIKRNRSQIPIFIISGDSNIDLAVESKNEGADHFFLKPIHFPQLLHSINLSLKNSGQVNECPSSILKNQTSLGLIGQSTKFIEALNIAKKIAPFNSNVLISGESGTGKELFARTIHELSGRSGPFVAINCSAIPENLLEAELFGHSKGAFTGAIEKRIGLFEEANNGTLFLDEIGDLAFPLQAKLLRVLQERKIKRIGENIYRDFSARILCATHKNLKNEVDEGKFREDLYYRLNVLPIEIPSLKERPEDIIALSEFFIKKYSLPYNLPDKFLSEEAKTQLISWSWKGNIRELENTIERAVILSSKNEIQATDIFPTNDFIRNETNSQNFNLKSFFDQKEKNLSLDEITKQYIKVILKKNDGAKEQTAKELGIDRKTLYRKLKEIESSNLQ
jgi:two-component system response regulator HydG